MAYPKSAKIRIRTHYPKSQKTTDPALNLAGPPLSSLVARHSLGRRALERCADLPLQRRQNFATRDAEEAHAFLNIRGFRLDMPVREAVHLDMRVSGVFLPGTYFGRLQYGAATARTAGGAGRRQACHRVHPRKPRCGNRLA
jgi:hypothetical protein